jgi:FkbM family methyltransferase
VEAVPGVAYFLASCVHPDVFDKLLKAGCRVYLWHLSPIEGQEAILKEHYPKGYVQIPGGCTMGLRWLTLGYHLGFRKFNIHGMDSSFEGKSSHAYPDYQDDKDWVTFDGYQTRPNFIAHATDFISMMERIREEGVDPLEIRMFGHGLLQDRYRHWLKKNPPFEWPETDVTGKTHIMAEARAIPEFLKFIPRRGVCVQAGGNVGVYPRRLARDFRTVYTFEPEAKNIEYLERNCSGYSNIVSFNAALGATLGNVGLSQYEEGNVGTFRVTDGETTRRMTIDWLGLAACDLIWLDIEGQEESALEGAAATIDAFKPAIIIEEKLSLGAKSWLEARQYHRVVKHGNDCLYVYGGP